MKILSSVLNCIFSFTVFSLMLQSFQTPVQAGTGSAANTQFQQSILPVRFIYFDEKAEITRIFNNVTPESNIYVIKFFAQNGEELPVAEELLLKYQTLINTVDMFQQGFFSVKATDENADWTNTLKVNLVNSPQGLQEIYTYL